MKDSFEDNVKKRFETICYNAVYSDSEYVRMMSYNKMFDDYKYMLLMGHRDVCTSGLYLALKDIVNSTYKMNSDCKMYPVFCNLIRLINEINMNMSKRAMLRGDIRYKHMLDNYIFKKAFTCVYNNDIDIRSRFEKSLDIRIFNI